MTNQPLFQNEQYLNKSLSISLWGNWPIPAVPIPPEYFFYSTYDINVPAIPEAYVYNITSSSFSWYGLQNSYNAKLLLADSQF